MEKEKHKKLKTIQMRYPAPYSQSWSNTEPEIPKRRNSKSVMKKTASFQGNNRKYNPTCCTSCWTHPKPVRPGCDPYAPHLKYGLFPRKIVRDVPSPMANKPLTANKFIEDTRVGNFIKNKKKSPKKAQPPLDAPTLVIRPIDKCFTRQLSMSEIMHIDIRPLRNPPVSPPRGYSPVHITTSTLLSNPRAKNRRH